MSEAIDRLAKIVVSGDRSTASLCLEPGMSEADVTEDALRALLTVRKIGAGDENRRELIRQAVKEYQETGGPVEIVIARATPPVHGKDGSFELDPALADPDAKKGEDAAVSFYDRSSFVIVQKGQRLGQVFEPTDGEDGVDALGERLCASAGLSCPMRFDDSVHIAADGTVTAAIEGQLLVRGGLLRVSKALTVPESVDFSTGNVDFPGDVIVRGGVRDCFIVKCSGDLQVRDLVEAATLEAGRDVRLLSGMAARDKGSVAAGRDLHAKYLDSVQCAVHRDMSITREIQNCTVIVGRRFLGPDCAVVGGSLAVAGRVEVGQLGSPGAPTELTVGYISDLGDLASRAVELIPTLERQIRTATERREQIERSAVKYLPAQIEEMNQLRLEAERAQASLEPLRMAVRKVVSSLEACTETDVLVKRMIHQRVTLWLGGHRAVFETALRGPVRIRLDAKGRPFILDVAQGRTMALTEVARLSPAPDRFLDPKALAAAIDKAA